MALVAEFWCMRIVVTAPWRIGLRALRPQEEAAVLARVRTGDYCLLPSGNIVEPIEVYDSQAKATERAAKEARMHPEQRYLVVMNADPEDLAKSPEAASS